MSTSYVRSTATEPTARTASFGAMLLPDHGAEKHVEEVESDTYYYMDQLADADVQSLDDDLIRDQDDLLPIIPPTRGYKVSSGTWAKYNPEEGCVDTLDQLWGDFIRTEAIDHELEDAMNYKLEDAMDRDLPHCATAPIPATSDSGRRSNSQLMPTDGEVPVPTLGVPVSIPKEKYPMLKKMFRYATDAALEAAWKELDYTYVRDPERNKPHVVTLEKVARDAGSEPGTAGQGDSDAGCPHPHLRCLVIVDGVKCRAMYRTSQERTEHMEKHYLGRYLCPGVCIQRWYHSRAELVQHATNTACSPHFLQRGVDYLIAKEPRWMMSPEPLNPPPEGDPFNKHNGSAHTKCPRATPRRRR